VGIRPVAVTVPSIRFEGSGDETQWLHHHIAQRRALNGLIAAYCVGKGLPWVDLFAATVEQVALCLAAPYSNDGLHLTTEGYKTFAVLLHTQVFAARFPS
jgi:acyl-CoA thioesterase-1